MAALPAAEARSIMNVQRLQLDIEMALEVEKTYKAAADKALEAGIAVLMDEGTDSPRTQAAEMGKAAAHLAAAATFALLRADSLKLVASRLTQSQMLLQALADAEAGTAPTPPLG